MRDRDNSRDLQCWCPRHSFGLIIYFRTLCDRLSISLSLLTLCVCVCERERERGCQVTEWKIIGTDILSLNCRGHRTFRSRKYRYIYIRCNIWVRFIMKKYKCVTDLIVRIKSNHLEYAAEIMINNNNNDACLTWDTLFRSVNLTQLCWNNSKSIICVWIDSRGSAVANISATFHWWFFPPSNMNFKLNANKNTQKYNHLFPSGNVDFTYKDSI